ncbi:unnamed protein product [Blepharisma stoltei]|uniref:Uncharacterized protein n=1 Tax=Blepharisma stoltei TaxID=1481888 RepID=A0AAU9K149_9CILI|nr:unnamed protein product [Blepharisma stoltei]
MEIPWIGQKLLYLTFSEKRLISSKHRKPEYFYKESRNMDCLFHDIKKKIFESDMLFWSLFKKLITLNLAFQNSIFFR